MLQVINANIVAYATRGKRKTKFKPYPRPGRSSDTDERKIGKGALPKSELRAWIRRKREHGKR